jgi:hypothetical protein
VCLVLLVYGSPVLGLVANVGNIHVANINEDEIWGTPTFRGLNWIELQAVEKTAGLCMQSACFRPSALAVTPRAR